MRAKGGIIPQPQTKETKAEDLAICLSDIKTALQSIQELRSKISAPATTTPEVVSPAAAKAVTLIDALIRELPPLGAEWPTEKRVRWLRSTATIFDMLYENGGHVIRVEVDLGTTANP